MNWLAVIRASRENLLGEIHNVAQVDIFDEDTGKEVGLDPLEAIALAAVLKTTTAELKILAMGSKTPLTTAGLSIRENLVDVIEETELALQMEGSFSPLFEFARKAAARMQEAQWLEDVAANNRDTLASLKNKLQGNQKTKQKELHKKQEIIASLKDQLQDLARKRDVTLSYVDRLLASKREQNSMKCDIAEQKLRSEIKSMCFKLTQEAGVHDSMINFLNYAIQDLHQQIEKWTLFLHDEIDRRSGKIKILEVNIAEEKIKVAGLRELYEEHQREINEYLEYKEQKRLEAEHDQFLYNSATKIQAWWRGTMVRRCLGPYRKKKKMLGKDKKTKK